MLKWHWSFHPNLRGHSKFNSVRTIWKVASIWSPLDFRFLISDSYICREHSESKWLLTSLACKNVTLFRFLLSTESKAYGVTKLFIWDQYTDVKVKERKKNSWLLQGYMALLMEKLWLLFATLENTGIH